MLTSGRTGTCQAAPSACSHRRLHILVVTGSYAPDRTGMAPLNTELCEYLVWRGHRVSVITCLPHYPEWKVPEAYCGKWWPRETMNGVAVYRSRVYIPAKRTTVRRILYDTSIGIATALRGLRIRHVDLVLGISPPLQAAVASFVLARVNRAPFLLQLKDLVPDLPIALGMLRNRVAIWVARRLESFVYRRAKAILVLCEGFRANLRCKGVPDAKIRVVPDWVDTAWIRPECLQDGFREALGLGPADFLVLHTGNMGAKQKLEIVLDSAAQLRQENRIVFCLVGDGAEKERLVEAARRRALKNVQFLPLQPRESLPGMLTAAQALLLNQSAKVVDMVIPSKLLTYMAAGRPIVAAVAETSEAARTIARAGCGIVVPPEDSPALAAVIRKLSADSALAAQLSQRGRAFAKQHFSRDCILERLENHFLAFAARK